MDDATGGGTALALATHLAVIFRSAVAGRLMSAPLEAVRPVTLEEIERARTTISRTVLRTPLVRLELGAGRPEIRLKLENLQPTNSYKLRGAANAIALLPESDRSKGVWTISAGN